MKAVETTTKPSQVPLHKHSLGGSTVKLSSAGEYRFAARFLLKTAAADAGQHHGMTSHDVSEVISVSDGQRSRCHALVSYVTYTKLVCAKHAMAPAASISDRQHVVNKYSKAM